MDGNENDNKRDVHTGFNYDSDVVRRHADLTTSDYAWYGNGMFFFLLIVILPSLIMTAKSVRDPSRRIWHGIKDRVRVEFPFDVNAIIARNNNAARA